MRCTNSYIPEKHPRVSVRVVRGARCCWFGSMSIVDWACPDRWLNSEVLYLGISITVILKNKLGGHGNFSLCLYYYSCYNPYNYDKGLIYFG